MSENKSLWSPDSFQRRLSIFSHSAILLTILILAMIHLESVLKPFFIAMGIYFVLKPGAEWISKGNNFTDMAETGDEIEIITNQTPFYAESGGQVGDRGNIVSGEFNFEVKDVQKKIR